MLIRPRYIAAAVTSALVHLFGLLTPACALPPSIPVFSAEVSDLNKVKLRWVTLGGYDNNPLRFVYINGPRLYPPEGWFPVADDVGYQFQSTNGEEKSVEFRIDPGTWTYTLEVENNTHERSTRSLTVDVPRPTPPVVTSPNPVVMNPFNPQGVTIIWSFNPPGDSNPGTVEVARPDGSTVTPPSQQYVVTPEELEPLGDRRHTYTLTHCKTNADGKKICSEGSRVTVDLEGAQFDEFRRTVPTGSNPIVTWSGPGNMLFVESPTLNLDADTTPNSTIAGGTSLTLTSPPAGLHRIHVAACNLFSDFSATCTSYDVRAPKGGTVAYLVAAGPEVLPAGTTIATVALNDGGTANVTAPTDGRVDSLNATNGSQVAGGTSLATMTPYSTMLLQVGESSSWTAADWTTAFNTLSAPSSPSSLYSIYKHSGAGVPLDIVMTGGNIWSIGEYHQAVSHVDAGGTLVTRAVPLFSAVTQTNHGWVKIKTRPFGSSFDPQALSSTTAIAERVIEGAPGQIWFTQGGGGVSVANHSRIVRFDTTRTDDLATPHDDRFCVYAVPGSRNEVYGIAWDGARIWFVENRMHSYPSAISTFDPATTPCSTFIDYQDPSQVNALSYCAQPFAAGCITELIAPAGTEGFAHITVDPNPAMGTTELWITEVWGRAVARFVLTPLNSYTFTRYPVPTSSRDDTFPYGQMPWRIETDANYVYWSEFFDADLVRLDKTRARAGDAECRSLNAQGKNPCMTEVHAPLRRPNTFMNAIQLRNGRLWFALDSGQIGYVDTASWNGGVLYTGMDALVERQRRDVAPAGFNGISIDASGVMAVSDFYRRQVIRLQPKP